MVYCNAEPRLKLLCDVACVMTCSAILMEHRVVTDKPSHHPSSRPPSRQLHQQRVLALFNAYRKERWTARLCSILGVQHPLPFLPVININGNTRHRASASVYSPTFRVRLMLPQQRNPCTDCKSAQQCTTRGHPLSFLQVTSESVQ